MYEVEAGRERVEVRVRRVLYLYSLERFVAVEERMREDAAQPVSEGELLDEGARSGDAGRHVGSKGERMRCRGCS